MKDRFWQKEGIVFQGRPASPLVVPFCDCPAGEGFRPSIESFWWMTWDLRGKPIETAVVPSGCVNLILEDSGSRESQASIIVVGPKRKAHASLLVGSGRRLGMRFFPGGFFSLFGLSAQDWCDRVGSLSEIVGDVAEADLKRALLATNNNDMTFEAWKSWIKPRIPDALDPKTAMAVEACRIIIEEESLLTVKDLRDRLDIEETRLQRIFRTHVGLTPKWMIRTHRFQMAVSQVIRGVSVPWTEFALSLGYFDQAHFIRDFRAITGQTPTSLSPSVDLPDFSNT